MKVLTGKVRIFFQGVELVEGPGLMIGPACVMESPEDRAKVKLLAVAMAEQMVSKEKQ